MHGIGLIEERNCDVDLQDELLENHSEQSCATIKHGSEEGRLARLTHKENEGTVRLRSMPCRFHSWSASDLKVYAWPSTAEQ